MSTTAHNFEASTSAFFLGQAPIQQNSKFKAYSSAVDKALKSFESTTEWADLIAALVKLGKVFSSNAKNFNDIPNSLTVAKRLSQCLHPALPSGVHLKALDTYRQVFLILGKSKNLAKYLFLYAAGLFPLMDHCGIKVKSELLAIFEQFLLPLGPDLHPLLPGFITALLLALEEGTEFYGRAFYLLDKLIEKVGCDPFYICFWQAVMGNPSARLPALTFVNAKIEKRKGPVQSNELFNMLCADGKATKHMLNALCAVAEDTGSPLIQRHLLDFLCTTLPLDSQCVSKADLVQLLRRCLFLVLRRDMSLNRRLYQWILNRFNDNPIGLSMNGVEDSVDLDFFKKYTLPLIKFGIREYLRMDMVEFAPTTTGTIRNFTQFKNSQIQYPEVRVCRLLHYMLDRPELGQLVVDEILTDLLEAFCTHDTSLVLELQRECEEFDTAFNNLWDISMLELKDSDQEEERRKRADECRKNFNALLNALEPNFLWNFFTEIFIKIKSEEISDESISVDFSIHDMDDKTTLSLDNDWLYRTKKLRTLYPLMILHSIKNVQLDSHSDIRGRHLPSLLRCILSGINIKLNPFSHDNLIAIVVVCRHLLSEVTQSNVCTVFESIQEDNVETSPSKKNMKCNKELAEEQKLVELSLDACLNLLSSVSEWYVIRRERRKLGVLTCISALIRDFAEFPFFSLQPLAALSSSDPQSPSRSLTDSLKLNSPDSKHLGWLYSLINVIEPISWHASTEPFDFDMRTKFLDLILYLFVRSASIIEQHNDVFGRALNQKSIPTLDKKQKTTTTVLLKPFLSQKDLNEIEGSGFFKKSASVLWNRFSENTELNRLQNITYLLLRLHSRRLNDSSSEVEDTIVSDLTSANKVVSGNAARKFRDLWMFCRSSQIEEVYRDVPLKPMNRVIMVLLGFIVDDSLGTEQVELRALAYSWFNDCSRNNDLHKILQMLTLMLLNPTTSRVSIQFVQMSQRITNEQLSTLPNGINCVSLTTVNGKQTFHHVCKDVDAGNKIFDNVSPTTSYSDVNSWSNYNYISCDSTTQTWVSELNKQLLLPSDDTDMMTGLRHTHLADKKPEKEHQEIDDADLIHKNIRKTHNRTMSDIPQFDNDAESTDSLSLDTSLDQDIVDVIQYLVDTICDLDEDAQDKIETNYIQDTLDTLGKTPHQNIEGSNAESNKSENHDRFVSVAQEADDVSVVGSLITPAITAAALPRISAYSGADTIKRIRTGHRRQDSLQESIFSTGTHELRLFDPTELPNSTCPGDYKQPLLDETFSHMLFYAESPSMVDLGRAEKLFRTINTLLKGENGLGKQIVSCMLFTNMSNLNSGFADRSSIGGASTVISQQLMDFMARHYRHIQGEGFWDGSTPQSTQRNENNANNITENKTTLHQKNSTLFEIFATVIIYFVRSYYLNSPINNVSPEDHTLAWKCKIAALDCFTELLHILDGIVKDVGSKKFATFVQHTYRQTKTQKVVLTLMLAAVPTSPNQKCWKMPLTMDIAEFNNGPQKNSHFRDLIYAYHRSLINLASSLVTLEYSLLIGMRYYNSQAIFGFPTNFSNHPITENQINYNSSQNRSTIREARYSVVELRLFLGVILNALKRCPERHELWLQFLIGILPYLDRALATFVIHISEQICRNLFECVFLNSHQAGQSYFNLSTPITSIIASIMEQPKSPIQFVDFRFARPNDSSNTFGSQAIQSEWSNGYPANYILILMESLMSITHFSLVESNFTISQQMHPRIGSLHFSSYSSSCIDLNPPANRNSIASSHGAGGSTFSSTNMTSMVGSAISVIPGTGLINNLFGRVFTSSENSGNLLNNTRNDTSGLTPEWLEAQRELIKRFPSILAILSDVWSYFFNKNSQDIVKSTSSIGTHHALATLVLNILNPIAKKHKNTLINSMGIVWIFRSDKDFMAKATEQLQCTFVYSSQQMSIAQLALKLNSFSLNSIIISVSEILKELINKNKTGFNEKIDNHFVEVSLLELLHECTRRVPLGELRDSWSALNILFNESPLGQLPARASFLEFIILVDFVRLCGSQTIIEDRYISKSILDICQKLIDAINAIVGWQLESTTWLKRTLVVRQDAAAQKSVSDLSPVLDQKGIASSAVGLNMAPSSEVSSIRGSTISLSAVAPSRLSAFDIQSTTGGIDIKKSASSLRSSLKDSGVGNRKDPTESTQALFLLAENLTDLIDSVTKSEDKEKLLPFLQAVWNNTLPYLKSKSAKNVRSFLASSQLLASMSSFNYMRPIWKKNAMELLWDSSFFKMDIHALKQWLVVIDNLMTNDKTSFKELLARITTSSSTTLSTLITSKDQEYEMRSQCLKRLAFVILSSELDQYSGQLNEIQERLTENLRLCQAPVIHTQVFVCYRVLMVRMSPNSFVSIWPSMITELIQVLAQIEQYLSTTNTSVLDEQKSVKDEQLMQLFLASGKLLETLFTLPSGYAPQFQMCRWSFISPMNVKSMSDMFVPYAVRLNNLLNIKYGPFTKEDLEVQSISLFNVKTLTSLREIHPLLHVLASQNNLLEIDGLQNGQLSSTPNDSPREKLDMQHLRDEDVLNGLMPLKSAMTRIEHSLYVDFAEHWQL